MKKSNIILFSFIALGVIIGIVTASLPPVSMKRSIEINAPLSSVQYIIAAKNAAMLQSPDSAMVKQFKFDYEGVGKGTRLDCTFTPYGSDNDEEFYSKIVWYFKKGEMEKTMDHALMTFKQESEAYEIVPDPIP